MAASDIRLERIEANTSQLPELLERRQPRNLVPFLIFFALFCLFATLGFYVMPAGETRAEMAGQFRIEVPYFLADGGGVVQIKDVYWIESHGLDAPFMRQADPPVPAVQHGHTRIVLHADFARAVTADAPIEMVVELPDGAAFNGCHARFKGQQRPLCTPGEFDEQTIASGSSTRLIKVAGLIAKGTSSFAVNIDLSGIDGINFDDKRTRLDVRFPVVGATKGYGQKGQTTGSDDGTSRFAPPTIEVGTGVELADAGQVSWSDRPDQLFEASAGWRETMEAYGSPPGMVHGVRDQLLEKDVASSFWAGVFFALASAALMAVVDVLITWWRERHQPLPD